MNYGSQSSQAHCKNMGQGLSRAHGDSQSLKWQSGSLHGSVLGRFSAYMLCLLTRFFEGTPDRGSGDISDSCMPLGPFSS